MASFRELARRVTGIWVPVFGLSWAPPEDQREIVRRLVIALADRRVLYQGRTLEFGPHVLHSVQEIRAELTATLQQAPEQSEMVQPLEGMRAACRKFLDSTQGPRSRRMGWGMDEEGWLALGELRGVLGLHLVRLAVSYGIDLPDDLAELAPAADSDGAEGSPGEPGPEDERSSE